MTLFEEISFKELGISVKIAFTHIIRNTINIKTKKINSSSIGTTQKYEMIF